MAFINLLHNGYQGKLGETVGQKWKNQRTVRTYNPHNNSKSDAQLEQRAHYKQLISEASLLYPYSKGWPKNALKNMNTFNHFTSTLEEIRKRGNPQGILEPINIFNKKGVWGQFVDINNDPPALFIQSSSILTDENIQKVKVIALFASTNVPPRTKFTSQTIAARLEKVEPIPDDPDSIKQEGWLCNLRVGIYRSDNLYLALKIPYKGKIYYSTLSSSPWEYPPTEEKSYNPVGSLFNLYFN